MKKTLIIFNHPYLENSFSHCAFLKSLEGLNHITLRNLDKVYGEKTKSFDVSFEQELLLSHERIIFQFPFFWYSTPALIKAYQDEVFLYGFAYGSNGTKLMGKEFKIITTIGAPQEEYQLGGWNARSVNECFAPFASMANLTKMHYTKALCFYESAFLKEKPNALELLEKRIKLYLETLQSSNWLYTKIKQPKEGI